MRWFVNLTIGKKLLSGFMFIALIAVALGMIGIMNIKALYDSDTEMHDSLIAVSLMGDLSTYFQRMRVNIADLVNAQTMNEMLQDKQKVLAREDDMAKCLAEFEKSISSSEEGEAVQRLHAQQKNFTALTDRLIGLCEEGKSAEAQAIWRSEAEQTRKENQAVLATLIDMQKREGETRSQINQEQASSAITMMIVLLVIGVVVAVAIAIFITRLITAPLAKGVSMMDELSKAHLGSRLALDRADEVGILANRMDGFAEVLQEMVRNINTVAEGNLSVDIKPLDANDEIAPAMIRITETLRALVSEAGMLTAASVEGRLQTRGDIRKFNGGYKEIIEGVNRTLDTVMLPINEASAVLEALAGGDLTARVQGDYRGDHQIIAKSINALAESLDTALGDVLEAAGATARASDDISSSTEEMAAGAHEQTQQAAEVASAVEEMSKTILETTRNANDAAAAAQRAGVSAKEGGRVVQETMEGMVRIADVVKLSAATVMELGKSSDQIGEIVQVIDDIADQTNLLALNAAIEAARAGEQGRGFAVVADEVRKLAERTTKATKEIAEMIKRIQKETGHAMEVMESGTREVERGRDLAAQSGASLHEIIDDAGKVLDIVSQVAAASEEQSTAGEQISRNIEAISGVTQESAAGTQQIARSAEELNRLMANLQNLLGQFSLTTKAGISQKEVSASPQMRLLSTVRSDSYKR